MHGENLLTKGADGVWETTYVKNLPVFLDNVAVRMFGTGAGASFNINATDPDDNYDVAYYKRGADGKPADDQELTGDIQRGWQLRRGRDRRRRATTRVA